MGCEAEAAVRESCKVSELTSLELGDAVFEGEYFIHAVSRNSGNIGSGKEMVAHAKSDDGTLYVTRNCTYLRYAANTSHCE